MVVNIISKGVVAMILVIGGWGRSITWTIGALCPVAPRCLGGSMALRLICGIIEVIT